VKKVLLIQYSQTGQLTRVASQVVAPLVEAGVQVTVETLKPKSAYPHPWPLFRFFDTFPEAVYLDAPEMEALQVNPDERFDLVILGYPVWFLSPALPVTAFLQSEAARRLLKGTPVVTLIACRDMWLMAQEETKKMLAACGARLVGNIALVDEAGTIGSFLATPVWALTGKRGPHLGGLIPRAGVSDAEVQGSRRFGERLASVLGSGGPLDETLLRGMGAVRVNEKLIASEKTARRSFKIWGALLRSLGPQGSWLRQPVLVVYIAFLVTLLIVMVPLNILIKKLLAPLTRDRVAAQKAYYGQPSEG
jgi:hypothetical protein